MKKSKLKTKEIPEILYEAISLIDRRRKAVPGYDQYHKRELDALTLIGEDLYQGILKMLTARRNELN